MSASALPTNVLRVSEVVAVGRAVRSARPSSPGYARFAVHLKCGRTLPDVDCIIICTGYQFTVPFLPQYNSSDTRPTEADGEVLVTDGGQIHNLHRDIFYMPDPSLAFVGLPIFNTVFSLFEFQAIAVAALFSGVAQLPSAQAMADEYRERVKRRGYGRLLHSLMEEEEDYVDRLISWVNEGRERHGMLPVEGHSATWKHEMDLIQQEVLRLRAAKAAEQLEASELKVAEKVEIVGAAIRGNEISV